MVGGVAQACMLQKESRTNKQSSVKVKPKVQSHRHTRPLDMLQHVCQPLRLEWAGVHAPNIRSTVPEVVADHQTPKC